MKKSCIDHLDTARDLLEHGVVAEGAKALVELRGLAELRRHGQRHVARERAQAAAGGAAQAQASGLRPSIASDHSARRAVASTSDLGNATLRA